MLLALVAATGLLVAPGGAAEVRAAAPGLTIVTSARYDVQPEAHRVRVTLDMTLTNRLSDTSTKRYYFDHAILGVLPGVSGLKASWSGAGTPAREGLEDHEHLHAGPGRSREAPVQPQVRDDQAGLRPGRQGRRRGPEVRIGSSLVSFPVWAFATDATAGSSVRVVFPAGYNVEVQAGRDPVTEDRCERPDRVPDAQAGQAAVVLRLPRRRQAGELRRADGQGHRR